MNAAEELLKRIAGRMEAAGYVKKTFRLNNCECSWQARYHKPERDGYFYYGTYLNPFSCLDYNEEPGKVYLWSDVIGHEGPEIFLQTVSKHNGAEEDVSVDMFVIHDHFAGPYKSDFLDRSRDNPIFMRELAKSPKPIDGTMHVNNSGKTVLKIRLRKNPSDRVIDNAIRKASAAFDEFTPNVHNDELARADFPKDSTEEHFAWETAWKTRHGR